MKKILLGLILVLAIVVVLFKDLIFASLGIVTADALLESKENIKEGMTYAQVEQVMKMPGRTVASLSEDGETLEIYLWEVDGAKVGVLFKDGKVEKALSETAVKRYIEMYRRMK